MIQFSTQPLPGLAPVSRAGFPFSTTSDFALALADLAGGMPGDAVPSTASVSPIIPDPTLVGKRPAIAGPGTILPEDAALTGILDCMPCDTPLALPEAVAWPAVALETRDVGPVPLALVAPVIAAPTEDGATASSDTPENARPRETVVTMPIDAPTMVGLAAPILPPDIQPTISAPSVDPIARRPVTAPSSLGAASTLQPPVLVAETASNLSKMATGSPLARSARPLPIDRSNVKAQEGSIPADTSPLSTPSPTPVAGRAHAAAPARPDLSLSPAIAPLRPSPAAEAQVSGPPERGSAAVVAAPTVLPLADAAAAVVSPTPLAAPQDARFLSQPIQTATTPRARQLQPSTAVSPMPVPIGAGPVTSSSRARASFGQVPTAEAARSITRLAPKVVITPAVTQRLDQVFAPVQPMIVPDRIAAPLPAAFAPPAPQSLDATVVWSPVAVTPPAATVSPMPLASASRDTDAVPTFSATAPVVVASLTTVTAPDITPIASPLSPNQPITVQSVIPAQPPQPTSMPADITPVTVTVSALPANPPPAPQLQPAAQAFAAAMFAASAPVVPDDRDDDDAMPMTLTAVAPSALPTPTLAVGAPVQAQAAPLDLAKQDWMATMIDRIETLRDDSGGVRETRMKLLPEALGSVEVSVRRDETGAIRVHIAADTAQARALLAEAAPKLAEMAEARGVRLGGSSVDAGAGDSRRDAPPPAPAPVVRRPASAARDTTTETASDTRLA